MIQKEKFFISKSNYELKINENSVNKTHENRELL